MAIVNGIPIYLYINIIALRKINQGDNIGNYMVIYVNCSESIFGGRTETKAPLFNQYLCPLQSAHDERTNT
jgi:hypothetical protein